MQTWLLACTAAAFAGVIVLLLAGTGFLGAPPKDEDTRIDTRG